MAKREKGGNFLLPNAPTWIVASDSVEARIVLTERRFGPWTEVGTIRDPAPALRERERGTDRPGRVFDSFGKGRHAMAPEETGQQHDMHRFAHHIGGYLNNGLAAGKFDHLVIIAEPSFLGYLRQELSATSKKSVLHELPVNPGNHDIENLRSLLT